MHEAQEKLRHIDLGVLEEGSEDEDEDDEKSENSSKLHNGEHATMKFTPSEVAQAFSHFSYWATGRKRLICDIQGVYDENSNLLKLSDPVIHYYNLQREEKCQVHGITDRGKKGICLFFHTHEKHCNKLCMMTTHGLRKIHKGPYR